MLVSSGPSECFVAGVYILIAAGALMMVVGFLGCCGAIKESPCMLGLVSDFFCVLVLHITLKTGDFAVNHEFMLRFFSWHISEITQITRKDSSISPQACWLLQLRCDVTVGGDSLLCFYKMFLSCD